MKPYLLAGVLLVGSPLFAQEYGANWYEDFDLAAAAAKEQKKDLFVDFTGSDWCGWCIKLDEEIFSHEAFAKGAEQDFILVALDFPKAQAVKDKVPNPKRNKELQTKYEVGGFPTILLMTADGEVYAQTGYKPMSPEEYIADVRNLRAKGKQALEDAKSLTVEFDKAKDKLPVVRKAIDALHNAGDAPAGAILAEIVRKGIALDPENKTGLKLDCVKALVLQGQAAPGEMALALELDPKNELGMMEAVVDKEREMINSDETRDRFLAHAQSLLDTGKVHKAEKVSLCFAFAAYHINTDLGNPEKAKPFARKSLELGGLNENAVNMMKEIVGEQ